MATKTITEFVDDLDGSTTDVETVKFSLFGAAYEIDLSKGNQAKLEGALKPFLNAARKASSAPASRRGAGPRCPARPAMTPRPFAAWAAFNGVTVPIRGRIPSAMLEQYRAAGN